MKKFWRNAPTRFKIGAFAVAVVLILGFLFPAYNMIFMHGSNAAIVETNMKLHDRLSPSWDHWLGTTALGQDTFWMLCYSLGNSIIIGVIVGIIGTVVGVLYGMIAGFCGGTTDRIMMTVADTFIVIPSLPVLILMTSLLSGTMSIVPMALTLSLFAWAHPARHVRSMTLSMKERDFIATARFSGENVFQIVVTEILPYLLTWSLSNFMNAILVAIGQESSLAVLGLSSSYLPTLGNMIQWARYRQAIMAGKWLWIGSPIVMTVILFVSLFMLISGYNDYISMKRGKE